MNAMKIAACLAGMALAMPSFGQKTEDISDGLGSWAFHMYGEAELATGRAFPKMRIAGDTLFASMYSGLYCKGLPEDGAFVPYAFSGIPVLDFARSGDRMLALPRRPEGRADSLLLRSEDRGATFADCTPSIGGNDETLVIRGMGQSPHSPDMLLIATNAGLYKTLDFGSAWEKVSEAVIDFPVVEFHPADADVAFIAGTSSETQRGIVVRLDLRSGEASSYETADEGSQVTSLLFDTESPDVMWFAGSGTEKIGKSQDGGRTWQAMNTEAMEWQARIPRRTELFGSPSGTDTLYAVVGTQNSEVYLWRSVDAGLNWDSLFYETFSYAEVVVYPFDIAQHGGSFYLYFDSWIRRLDLAKLEPGAGNEGNVKPLVRVGPNPAQEYMDVETAGSAMDRIELWTVAGKQAKIWHPGSAVFRIDVSGMSPGLYMLRVHIGNACTQQKIIVL